MVYFLIVVLFAVALAAAEAIQCEYSSGGGVQWIPVSHGPPSIGQ